jgi:magnesium transporter
MMTQYDFAGNRLAEMMEGPGRVLVVIAPDERERALLQERYRLDDFDLASALDQDEVPRLDFADDRLLLIWKVPESAVVSDSVELGVNVVGLALFEDSLAFTRATGDVSLVDREFRTVHDARDVMLAFLLRTVRHFVSHLKVIRQISSELESKITVSMENRHLLQMFSLSESIVNYLDAIEGNAAVLAKLRNLGVQYGFQSHHLEDLDEVILENTQAARQASIFSTVHSGLMDARGTVVNNNMNVLLRNLMLINIVFLPLNLIAGIGGMSEWSMMTQGIDWRVSYGLFCFGMVLLGWATWIIMMRRIDRGTAQSDHDRAGTSAGNRLKRQ